MKVSLESTVRALVDRQQIEDLPRRYSRGVDRRDWALVRSCFSDDCFVDGSRASAPIDDYVAGLRPGVEYFPTTMHYMGNQLVEIDGDQGHVESYCVAFHWKHAEQAGAPHEANLTVGVRYLDSVRRVGDGWLIERRRVAPDWRVGVYPPV